MKKSRLTEFEKAVIGTFLASPEFVATGRELIKSEDFANEIHRKMVAAIYDMDREGRPVDVLTLHDYLPSIPLDQISDFLDHATNIPVATFVAQKIQEHSLRRVLLSARPDPSSDLDEIIRSTENVITNIASRRHTFSEPQEVQKIWLDVASNINEDNDGIPYGFDELDRLTAGLHPAELTIVAARPGCGKTALALNIAENVAEAGYRVLFFSLEMSRFAITKRLASSRARVNISKSRHGELDAVECSKLIEAMEKPLPISIVDQAGISVSMVKSQIKLFSNRHGAPPRLVIIDYAQIMGIPELHPNTPRHQQIAYVSRNLKEVTQGFNIPVILVSQLRRPNDPRDIKRDPVLSDLKESGALEQDADNVVFISTRRDAEDQLRRRIVLAKQRNGPVGDFDLKFLREFTRFEDYPGYYVGEGFDATRYSTEDGDPYAQGTRAQAQS